jgi:hypothetical protein
MSKQIGTFADASVDDGNLMRSEIKYHVTLRKT